MKYIITPLLTILLLYPAIAQDIPERPVPPRLVNDIAGLFSQNEVAQLEKKLVWFNQQTSTQIAVITVKDLQGYDISDFAFRLGDKWGVGQKGFNNGIVILIKPKTPGEKGKIFIATGYGLEAVVPDAIAKRIVEAEILPEFRKNNYYKGIDSAINTLFALTKGEFSPKEYAQRTSQNEAPAFGIGGFFLLIILFSIFGRLQRARHYSVGQVYLFGQPCSWQDQHVHVVEVLPIFLREAVVLADLEALEAGVLVVAAQVGAGNTIK